MNFLTKYPNCQNYQKIKNCHAIQNCQKNPNSQNSHNIKKILINSFQTIQTTPKINAEFSDNSRAEFSDNSFVAAPYVYLIFSPILIFGVPTNFKIATTIAVRLHRIAVETFYSGLGINYSVAI